ncbi:hypothetical protein METHP14_100019 [Pseudomonas sp. P14-2025]
MVGESKRLCWRVCLFLSWAVIRELHLLGEGLGLLRSPSQASQLLHRSWWLQGIWKAGDWGLRGENKKGPPFGEPFLILRMVPAPGIEPGTY